MSQYDEGVSMTGKVTPKRLPSPRTMLGWDGTDFFALKVDGSGHLQIDILTIPLPDDAATDTALKAVRDRIGALTSPAAGSVNARLASMYVSLQLIDNLPAALRTVGANALIAAGTDSVGAHHDIRTDTSGRPIVRGMDQLFSFHDTLEVEYHGNPNVDNGYIESAAVPAGELWVIRSIVAHDFATANSAHAHARMIGEDIKIFGAITQALAAGENSNWIGMQILRATETVRTYFTGSVVADTCDVWLNGYIMTKEA